MDNCGPNCRQCEYFHTTWDKAAPLGCKRFGFKSRQLPSLEVLCSTGKQCIFFESKQISGEQVFRPVLPQAALPDHCSFTIVG